MNERARNAKRDRQDQAKQYFNEMAKMTPAYHRYQSSLGTFVLTGIMDYCTKTIFARKQEYMKKFNISRDFFIKVFNLYCSLSFMTVMRSASKN